MSCVLEKMSSFLFRFCQGSVREIVISIQVLSRVGLIVINWDLGVTGSNTG